MAVLGCSNFTLPLYSAVPLRNHFGGNTDRLPSEKVIKGLAAFYIVAYGLVFFVSYAQLWIVFCYRCRRFSFQTNFLFLCLLWSTFRLTLFTFVAFDIQIPKNISLYWVFFRLPMCFQFFIFCLLTLYYAQVSYRVRPEYQDDPRRYKYPLRGIFGGFAAIFLAINIASTVIAYQGKYHNKYQVTLIKSAIYSDVIICDLLSVFCAVVLTICLIKIAQSPSAHILLRSTGTTVCRSFSIGFIMILLSLSSSVYDILALFSVMCDQSKLSAVFWYYSADEARDAMYDADQRWANLTYGFTLMIWEFIPTALIMFWKKVNLNCVRGNFENSVQEHFRSPVFFYDNPRAHNESENASLLASTSSVGPMQEQ